MHTLKYTMHSPQCSFSHVDLCTHHKGQKKSCETVNVRGRKAQQPVHVSLVRNEATLIPSLSPTTSPALTSSTNSTSIYKYRAWF